MQQLFSQITFGWAMAYIIVAFISWYIFYGFEMYMNGGSIGRGRTWVFKCFREDLRWFSPGGLAVRTEYIRQKVAYRPNVHGFIGGYGYEQIREQNLYELVAKKALGSGWYFWGVKVFAYFFLGPVVLIAALIWIVVVNLTAALVE